LHRLRLPPLHEQFSSCVCVSILRKKKLLFPIWHSLVDVFSAKFDVDRRNFSHPFRACTHRVCSREVGKSIDARMTIRPPMNTPPFQRPTTNQALVRSISIQTKTTT
ncbi:unnamed protein product, partial [Ectocarpus sp. 12 AP-2014]